MLQQLKKPLSFNQKVLSDPLSRVMVITIFIQIIFFCILPAILAPITFFDSDKYILLAKYFLTYGYDFDKCIIELSPGYPIFLSILISIFGETTGTGPCLGFFQGLSIALTNIFVGLIFYQLTQKTRIALLATVIAGLSIELIYFSATVFTEPLFMLTAIIFIFFIILAIEHDSLSFFSTGMFFLIVCLFIRPAMLPLIGFPFFSFSLSLSLKKKTSPNKSIAKPILISFIITVLAVTSYRSITNNNYSLKEKLAIVWRRAIERTDTGRNYYMDHYNDHYRGLRAWSKNADIPDLTRTKDHLFPLTPQYTGKSNITIPENRLLHWRTVLYYELYNGASDTEAFEKMSDIAMDVLLHNPLSILRSFIEDVIEILKKPIRAIEVSYLQYPNNRNQPYKFNLIKRLTHHIHKISVLATDYNLFLYLHIIVLLGLLSGFFLFEPIIYFSLLTILFAYFFISVFLSGMPLPRFFVLFIPFTGVSILNIVLVFRTSIFFNRFSQKKLKIISS